MLTITNGFTYIAFLMLLAGGLLALEKYMKWKIFNIVPPLVWIYIFNMFFCTIGLYNSDECSAAYSALKNNILYAMIFVMLLRCDFRKLGKLGPRMICIFMGCAITLGIGFFALFPLFANALGGADKTWAQQLPSTHPGSAALQTWLPWRRLFRSIPVLTPALWLSILPATPSGSHFCSLL